MQRLFPEGLNATLTRGLSPFYLLTGQDLLLVGDSKTAIIHAAKAQGFDEKTELAVNAETQWENLLEQAQSNGLFFNRQILILNLPESPTAAQHKELAALTSLSHPDLLLIFHAPKFTKAMEKQAWFQHFETQGVQINCQTPDLSKLPNWLQSCARSMELRLEPEAVQLLCYSYEGNLLALKQVLQLLQLQFPDGKISLPRAKEVVEQSAQFTPFQWIDALLEGKIARAERILRHLQAEDTQAVVLLRIVQKELLTLLELTRAPQRTPSSQPLFTGNLRSEFDRLKIWQNRRAIYQQAAQRLTYQKLYRLCLQLAELERQVKQEFNEDIWRELARFSVGFK